MSGTAGGAAGTAPAGVTLRDMNGADIPAVHMLERRLFPVDAWPLQMFHDELAQAADPPLPRGRRLPARLWATPG